MDEQKEEGGPPLKKGGCMKGILFSFE